MNAFTLSGILIATTSIGFGLFVFFRSTNKELARLWFVFSIAATVWGIGITCTGLNREPDRGLIIWQITYAAGVLWISPLFYHFVSRFLDEHNNKVIFLQYTVAALFLLLIPTALFFAKCELVFDQFCYIRGGAIYHVFMLWWFGLVMFSHGKLIKTFARATPARKNQIKYFFLATAVGYTGGFQTYLPKLGYDIYPWGSFLVPLYPAIMSYAILKYNLMDIRFFIRRAAVLGAIYLLLILGSAPFIVALHKKVTTSAVLPLGLFVFEVFLISGVLSLGPFIYAAFVRRTYWLKGHSTAGLAHELKSPLSAIQSAVSLLQDNQIKLASPHADSYLHMIQANTNRLETFIDDLLKIAKIQSEGVELKKQACNITAMIEALILQSNPLLKKKGLTVRLESKPGTQVLADSEKLNQILSNLLSNAIKFSDKGEIVFRVENITNDVLVSVSDQGCGIAINDLEKIFDRFFQGRTGAKGSGLGLAIAKAWVEAHGGKIWAESGGEGEGTTMRFTIPIL